MNISRLSYEKPRRCPNWNGPGWNNMLFYRPNKKWKDTRCDGGFITIRYWKDADHSIPNRWWKFNFHKCDKCGVTTLPYVTRYFDYFTYYLWFKHFDIYSYNRVRRFFLHTAPKFGWYSSEFFYKVKDEQ